MSTVAQQAATRAPVPGFRLLAAGVLATVAVVVFVVSALVLGGADWRVARRAREVSRLARQLLVAETNAWSAQDGYLITGDRRYLELDRTTIGPALLDQLRAAAGDHYEAELRAIAGTMDALHAELAATIAHLDRGDRDGAFSLASSDVGGRLMDTMRGELDAIIAAEDRTVEAGDVEVRSLSGVTLAITIVGGTITVLALAAGIVGTRRQTRLLAAQARDLAAQAEQLAHQSEQLGQGMLTLAASNRALTRSNHDLDQFAYVASHDLKAPLRAISSLASWIEEDLGDKVDDRVREHLRMMATRVKRMEDLIEGILGYSRAGRVVEKTDVDVRALVVEVKGQHPARDGIAIDVADGPWPVMRAPRVQLGQVWSNLIGNALKHGVPEGGRVEVGCARHDCDGGAWRFWVKDDGPGIEPAYHGRIFELFQRLASRDRVEGAGIGLSIVRKLVDANGGKVWVDSSPGQGTTFYFTWNPA
jgi:signal transduction histidine kinase